MTEIQLAIAREIHRALKSLGADAYALAALEGKADFYRLGEVSGAPPDLLAIEELSRSAGRRHGSSGSLR
jgi:hypothetical protein